METKKCYKQIKGPHETLDDAMKICDELGKGCNGIQYVRCKGNNFSITKSLFNIPCTSKPAYTRNPNCDIILYKKGIPYLKRYDKSYRHDLFIIIFQV